jgi:molecular chaperone GrpE
MRDDGNPQGPRGEPEEPGTIDLEDTGQTLEAVLEEEERSAIAAAEEKLKSVQKNLDELKDRHLRKLAEFENMRKRAEREKNEYFRHALANFLRDLFPISDSFDRALAHASPEELESDFGRGVALIRRQLDELWKKYGVTEVDTTQPFDPNVHEAVTTESSDDAPKDTILDVLRKGYLLNGKLLRPALVKVAVPQDDETSRKAGGVRRKAE